MIPPVKINGEYVFKTPEERNLCARMRSSPPDLLIQLSTCESPDIRELVAGNIATPITALMALTRDNNVHVRSAACHTIARDFTRYTLLRIVDEIDLMCAHMGI